MKKQRHLEKIGRFCYTKIKDRLGPQVSTQLGRGPPFHSIDTLQNIISMPFQAITMHITMPVSKYYYLPSH